MIDVMTVSTMNTINRKAPGTLPPPPKSEIDGKIRDLSLKTIPELLELGDRQLKLLNNKPFVSKLPDKGTKIQTLYDKIMKELQAKKQDEEKTYHLMHNLKLHGVDKESVQNMEWEGKIQNRKEAYLDSDDDSEPEDVLHILSQCTVQEKRVKLSEPEKLLLTAEDLVNIGEIPHVRYIVEKTETNPNLAKPKNQFKPFKTTKSDIHNPEKEILRKKHKHWEVTAATPPPIIHGPAKVLTLEESLQLQKDYNVHLKEVEAQHAAEKLLARASIKMADIPEDTTKFGRYRELQSGYNSDDSDPEGSDKEVHDEEPERGGVVFTIVK